jgi:NAD(P)-dependent dehydrogenase (short-subunit alcohol dehydrogenase family)
MEMMEEMEMEPGAWPTGRFIGQVALVTGGAKGIGKATVARLVTEGARVVVVDLDETALAALMRTSDPDQVSIRAADVADEVALTSVVKDTERQFGRLTVLINNAGIQHAEALADVPIATWDRLLDVNLRAAFVAIQAAIPQLAAGGGAIVNVASMNGLVAEANVAPYSAAKAGLVNLTRAAAMELAPRGIRVNCVCPGMTDTSMFRSATLAVSSDPEGDLRQRLRRIPAGRLVEPAEVAAAIAFLASSDASGITGASLAVDNGILAGWDYQPPAS